MEEGGIEAELGGEHEGASVVGVVPFEEVGHGSFGRGGLDRGVGVDDGGGGIESGIGDAPDADLAVVVGDVLEQPVHGVVHVGAFIGFAGLRMVDMGAHFNKLPLRLVAAADVLQDEDVAGAGEGFGGAEARGILIFAVRGDAVGSAGHEKGIGFGGVFGDVNGGEELDAVAHGDAELIFGVVRLEVEGLGRVGGLGEIEQRTAEDKGEKEDARISHRFAFTSKKG